MKAKYLYLAMVSLALASGFSACSDNNDDEATPTPNVVDKTPITFDADTVRVGVGATATFNITNGGGDYKIISENPEIASGTVSGSAVTVTSVKKGITGFVVSDAQGSYKRIIIKSMYFTITLDKKSAHIGIKLGHASGETRITVTGGNGNYTAVSADTAVCKVTAVSDSVITLASAHAGSTTVTITDMMGLTTTIPVVCEATDVPYTDDEKAVIEADALQRICWDDALLTTDDGYTAVNTKDNGQYKMGEAYVYYGNTYYWTYTWFSGDLTVGTKTGGKVSARQDYWKPEQTFSNVAVEIIKNDGKNVWGIMSVVVDGYLHYGYFCNSIQ